MLGLYLVNVHKRDHDSYCCQKQWQYQRTFHSQTCFFQPSERTAQGHFFRTTDFAFRGKQICPVFPKAFPFYFVISRLYLFNFFHAAAFARLLPQFCAMHRRFLKKHPCASFLITIFPCNGKHLSVRLRIHPSGKIPSRHLSSLPAPPYPFPAFFYFPGS